MKRLVKSVLKLSRRASEPIRRPFQRRLEHYLSQCLRPSDSLICSETNILMDQMVRELTRLRRQVESLQRTLEEHTRERDRLFIADKVEA